MTFKWNKRTFSIRNSNGCKKMFFFSYKGAKTKGAGPAKKWYPGVLDTKKHLDLAQAQGRHLICTIPRIHHNCLLTLECTKIRFTNPRIANTSNVHNIISIKPWFHQAYFYFPSILPNNIFPNPRIHLEFN